ncbi:MAG: hypothetical protein QOG16_1237 [Actinomycetota bacterium]|nr:hypothetical protein [Actinomycetota bacterium]
MPKLFSIKPSLTIKGRKFKGLRGWAGKPFHPPLTDIPIAAYILGAVFDVLSVLFKEDMPPSHVMSHPGEGVDLMPMGASSFSHDMWRAATFVFVAGLIVSIPTALTGFWDWLKSTPKGTQARRTANWHMAVMLTTTALVTLNVIWRLVIDDQAYTPTTLTVLSVVVAGLVSFGALYGGSLVYEMGFNVETAGDSPVWHESETDVYPGQD